MLSHIDKALRRAMLQEIGERLEACLKEEELPASLSVLLDQLRQHEARDKDLGK